MEAGAFFIFSGILDGVMTYVSALSHLNSSSSSSTSVGGPGNSSSAKTRGEIRTKRRDKIRKAAQRIIWLLDIKRDTIFMGLLILGDFFMADLLLRS
ncbi:MAG: hypothetical protein JSV50_17945 [Desulfobacteraceae bacterium]|nr:MAG: hypothetical protein JSV50_17945 [Desulfobacteraceae bacterium]